MDTRTWIYVGLGAAGLYALTRPRKTVQASVAAGIGKPHAAPPPSRARGPAFCEDPSTGADQAAALSKSFERAWDAFGFTPGAFGDLDGAGEKAHALALWVMEDVCPQLPRPPAEYLVPNYAAKHGPAWSAVYDAPYNWAWGRLVQMPV